MQVVEFDHQDDAEDRGEHARESRGGWQDERTQRDERDGENDEGPAAHAAPRERGVVGECNEIPEDSDEDEKIAEGKRHGRSRSKDEMCSRRQSRFGGEGTRISRRTG